MWCAITPFSSLLPYYAFTQFTIASLKPQNYQPEPPASAAAAAMLRSPQRRPRLPQKPPSDVLTLQRKRHLNLVATSRVGAKRPFII
jgi:hypothetical protein